MADPAVQKPFLRRRTCVICSKPTPNTYVTSFTRIADKQQEWINILSNGDEEFAKQLKESLKTGRKYLCLDHFDRLNVVYRKNEEGMEVIRSSLPIPYKNTFFVRHEFPENHRSDGPSTSSQSAMGDQSSDYQIPEKRRKIEVDLKGKGVEMDAASMSFLMNSVNSFVRKAMEEAPIHDN